MLFQCELNHSILFYKCIFFKYDSTINRFIISIKAHGKCRRHPETGKLQVEIENASDNVKGSTCPTNSMGHPVINTYDNRHSLIISLPDNIHKLHCHNMWLTIVVAVRPFQAVLEGTYESILRGQSV